MVRDPITGDIHDDFMSGIPVGKLQYITEGEHFRYILYNHWNIIIKTQKVENSLHERIVGFEVEPRSFEQGQQIAWEWQADHRPLYLDELEKKDKNDRQFSFTYSIITKNDVEA